jgi:hypothetical protein
MVERYHTLRTPFRYDHDCDRDEGVSDSNIDNDKYKEKGSGAAVRLVPLLWQTRYYTCAMKSGSISLPLFTLLFTIWFMLQIVWQFW